MQDVLDQRGIVRGYVKYENEIRTGRNIKPIVHRAMQLAHSDPKGPVYLTASREVLEEEVPPVAANDANLWRPVAPGAIEPSAAALIAERSDRSAPSPGDQQLSRKKSRGRRGTGEVVRHPGHRRVDFYSHVSGLSGGRSSVSGQPGKRPGTNAALEEADVVLVLDSDVPWIPAVTKPRAAARIYHIDVDPLKQQMPLWYFPMQHSFRADAATALQQMNAYIDGVAKASGKIDAGAGRRAAGALYRDS